MRKLNLYDIDVLLDRTIKGKRTVHKHVLYVGAKNHTAAVRKAVQVLNGSPHGVDPLYWRLTGRDKFMGKVFI